MRPLLNYFGGKWRIAPWIISAMPKHEIYCEVFGGSISVCLRKERSKREIVNDIDGELVNLYRVARDNGSELKEKLRLTPHSRSEYLLSMSPADNPVERARRTIVRCYFGIGDSFLHNHNSFRNSRESNTCVAKSWKSYWEQFEQITDRLAGVTIECLDWKKMLEKYDSKKTLFYLDPPYVHSTRSKKHNYRNELSTMEHVQLLEVSMALKGKVIISGYSNDWYELSLKDWTRIDRVCAGQSGTSRTEVLWIK